MFAIGVKLMQPDNNPDTTEFGQLLREWPTDGVVSLTSVATNVATTISPKTHGLLIRLENAVDNFRRHYDWERVAAARAQFTRKEYEKAIVTCTELLEDAGETPGVYYCRGASHAILGQFEHAVKDYTKALALAPDVAEYFAERAAAQSHLHT